jgi:hypothetical protein
MPSLSGVSRLRAGGSSTAASTNHPHGPHAASLAVLTVGALGVVYGDIGTSPLYALRECFHGAHGVPATRENVLGVLSLIFWSLTLIISIKYLLFVMRADNKGEGFWRCWRSSRSLPMPGGGAARRSWRSGCSGPRCSTATG